MGDEVNFAVALLAISFIPFFEARNQVANFVAEPPPEETAVKPELPDMMVRDACPGCGGNGELVLVEPNCGQYKGRLGTVKKVRRPCKLCGGKRRIQSFMVLSALARQVAADRIAFTTKHQSKGDIAVGEAFVPREIFDGLSREIRKLVAESYGHPCKKCNWTGIEACKKCKGSGFVPCTNADCEGGWDVKRTVVRKETKVSVAPCQTCGGAKLLVCPECNGLRAKPCQKCNGTGRKGSL